MITDTCFLLILDESMTIVNMGVYNFANPNDKLNIIT